jgi:hypothetical protein
MRLTDHVTRNLNNKISTAAVFLDIEKALNTMWHLGLVYELCKMEFSKNLIKLISKFMLQRKFRVSAEFEISAPRYVEGGVTLVSVLSPTLYNLYTDGTSKRLVLRVLFFFCSCHLSVWDRTQGRLCAQNIPARDKFSGSLM